MLKRHTAWLLCLIVAGCASNNVDLPRVNEAEQDDDSFVELSWNAGSGRLLFAVHEFDAPFIYQSSLARGLGSNDIGLDRGQLGATRIVRFVRSGPKVLLMQDNLDYRAQSDDADERRAVGESFARSVLWGFDIASETGDRVMLDGTDFFLRDAHGLAARLARVKEGDYKVDSTRSAIYMPRTRAFPDNTEIEAIVTYIGKPAGSLVRTVAPDAEAITVHMHHSFIRLPDDGYEPLPYDPRAGVIGLGYDGPGFIDYASPIGAQMFVNFGSRHRLQKKDPTAAVSEAVEPIVYYVDRGAPEPVRQALIDGASWWNEAFEAAGYRDAFQVRLLPEGVDPMDVRYNVIQWVHRSTRGWSYGSSVQDPRTGEILKGHVTLGSLRVRQDYMIAEGLLAPYSSADVPETMLDMSLARIRQLSAHEVGHTIGFEHNFAASTQDRASVMDYPVPLIHFADDGSLDLSDAYGVGIGPWDKRTVIYAYQDFPNGVDADAARSAIMQATLESGLKYVADSDARSVSSAHPDGNLWDNGADAIVEFDHLMKVRDYALRNFSERNIRYGRPEATLEEVLVPIYLLHRFQLHAVGKLIGGEHFSYSLRGDGQAPAKAVSAARQQAAIDTLIGALHPEVLQLPAAIATLIPPRPPGYPKSREAFTGATGGVFDPLAPAASATALTLEVLLDPERAARMNRQRSPAFAQLVDDLLAATWFPGESRSPEYAALRGQTSMLVLDALLRLAVDTAADDSVRAVALDSLEQMYKSTEQAGSLPFEASFARLAKYKIERMWADPASVTTLPEVVVPPGSPIGAASD